MKVLLIGNYRDNTGYGEACKGYARALDAVGVDVVLRPFRLSNNVAEMDETLLRLEGKSSVGADVCIQHTLPIHMSYNGHFKKNIALFASETFGVSRTSWGAHLKSMDELWVINQQMEHEWLNIQKPIEIIPHAIDLNKFKKTYEPLTNLPVQDTFVFYFISEISRRKNLVALLKAFHSEFKRNEPVSLVIKTNKFGMNDVECKDYVVDMCNMVKKNLKLLPEDKYKKEIIITQRLTDEQMLRLHATGNCLVAPSYAEAWNLAASDSVGVGNPVICTDIVGQFEFIEDYVNGIKVDSTVVPCFGMMDTFQELYSANEYWCDININTLREAMRQLFEYPKLIRKEDCQKSLDKYSYENIGKLMLEALEC